jgi:hypothetical protein
MATERGLYVGPRLRRIRRDLGLTQADMAQALDVSASYIALLERNNRPLTAGLLLKLAQTYAIDMQALGSGAAEDTARLQAVLKDPVFAGLEWAPNELTDMATNYPGVTEALLRLYTTYQEGQLAFADRGAAMHAAEDAQAASDPVAESRRFLAARRNSFPTLDDAAERLAQAVGARENVAAYFQTRHGLRVRRVPQSFMVGSTRRLDRHRQEVLLDDSLDAASQAFQLALQLSYLELSPEIDAVLAEGSFASESGERLTRRALASYAAAAVLMPYSAFARAVEARR